MATLALLRHGQSQWNLENRFTGWVDVPLSPQGEAEARQAGRLLAASGVQFHRAYTSVLQRAIQTLALALAAQGQTDLPVTRNQALNERHYGALQGLDKAETAKRYGDAQVHIWRRSYDVAPPNDVTELNPDGISESLKDTAARTLPYYTAEIEPKLVQGENILIAAHGNSLRSIVMHLDGLSREAVLELNIGTGVPILYEVGPQGRVQHKRVLDPPTT